MVFIFVPAFVPAPNSCEEATKPFAQLHRNTFVWLFMTLFLHLPPGMKKIKKGVYLMFYANGYMYMFWLLRG